MRRVSELVGKPVVSADTGERIGKVSDVLLDAQSRRMLGVVVSAGLFAGEQVLPYEDVQTIGKDALVARSAGGVVGPKGWRAQGLDTLRTSALTGRRVLSTSGRSLGELHDLQVDEQAGTVEAFEVAVAAMGGLVRRRALLPRVDGVTVGADAVLVPDVTADAMEESRNRA